MILDVFLLMLGFFLLLIGADKLVEGSSAIARRYNIPNIIIGLTIVAFGTSSPELVVNILASIKGNSDMVLGNVIGSNLFNVLVILGICSLIRPLSVKSSTTWIEIPLSFLAALAVFFVGSDKLLDGAVVNTLQRTDGWMLVLFFFIFLAYSLQVARSGQNEKTIDDSKPLSGTISGLYILFGLIGLIIGGQLIVTGAVDIASALGVPERIIALTIVAVGTSLPELATSLVAVRKGNVDIAIGNVVGSNIFNIFLVLGVSTILHPASVSSGATIDILLNIAASMLLFLFIFTGKGRRLEKREGGFFLFIYAGYIGYLISSSTSLL